MVQPAGRQVKALLRTAGAIADRMGVSAYAVGGFVRDLLLSRPNLDIDITVEGDGLAYARALGEALHGHVKEVPRFGTAHIYRDVPAPGLPGRIDVATARREFYEHAGALPVVEFAGLREDLSRRDFSVNAMAIRLEPHGLGALVDPFGGLQDIETGSIRILHPQSFVEDPTRVLRAVRFAHRYGFTIESETAEIARRAVAEGFLERVSMERLQSELVLLLQEPGSGGGLAMLREMGALARILPGVALDEEAQSLLDRVDQAAAGIPDLCATASLWLTKLLILLYPLPVAEAVALAHRLKPSREEKRLLLVVLTGWRGALATLTSPQATAGRIVHRLADWPPEGLLLLYLLGAGERLLRYWREWRHIRLAVTGTDLIQAGVPAGPAIGRALARVLSDRLDGLASDRETQLTLALRYSQEED